MRNEVLDTEAHLAEVELLDEGDVDVLESGLVSVSKVACLVSATGSSEEHGPPTFSREVVELVGEHHGVENRFV